MTEKIQEEAMEPDYEKFEELMAFWKSMPHEMHVSWHEALEAASALPEGKRSLCVLRRLITKARNDEQLDICVLEQKLHQKVSEWHTLIQKEDVEQKMPLAFGRLLGMKETESLTNHVWHFTPLASTRQMDSVWELVTSILRMLWIGQRSWGYELIEEPVRIQYRKFKAYLKERRQLWDQKWTIQFPELLDANPTDEMRAAVDEKF